MNFFKLLLLCVLLLAPLQTASAKREPARWWPSFERPKTGSYAEDKAIIQAVQYLLRARGQKLTVDGIFGRQTENAIISFQRRNGLIAKGKMNNATWEALIMPCKVGSSGDGVRALQALLRRAEYDIPVNATFGPSTRAAVLKFQNMRGLAADGIAGKQTWCALVDGTVGQPLAD